MRDEKKLKELKEILLEKKVKYEMSELERNLCLDEWNSLKRKVGFEKAKGCPAKNIDSHGQYSCLLDIKNGDISFKAEGFYRYVCSICSRSEGLIAIRILGKKLNEKK